MIQLYLAMECSFVMHTNYWRNLGIGRVCLLHSIDKIDAQAITSGVKQDNVTLCTAAKLNHPRCYDI